MKKNRVAGVFAAVLLAAGSIAGCGSTNQSAQSGFHGGKYR